MANKEGISGPHLAAAFLCEKVLTERDGVTSFIRMVDRFVIPQVSLPPGVQLPAGAIPQTIQFQLVLALKAGDFSGKYKMRIVLLKPDGNEASSQTSDVFFSGTDDNGVTAVSPITIPNPEEGLHWFDVYFQDQMITRIPFRVLYQQIQMIPFASS